MTMTDQVTVPVETWEATVQLAAIGAAAALTVLRSSGSKTPDVEADAPPQPATGPDAAAAEGPTGPVTPTLVADVLRSIAVELYQGAPTGLAITRLFQLAYDVEALAR